MKRDRELEALERFTMGIPLTRWERIWYAIEPWWVWHRIWWSAPVKRLRFYWLSGLRVVLRWWLRP